MRGRRRSRALVRSLWSWETADEMRVAGFEFRERPFGLIKRGFEEGVAVAGEHYVVAGGRRGVCVWGIGGRRLFHGGYALAVDHGLAVTVFSRVCVLPVGAPGTARPRGSR